jgi:hypothetical protein
MSGGLNLPHGLTCQRDDRGSPFSSLLGKMCLFAEQSATYKGQGFRSSKKRVPQRLPLRRVVWCHPTALAAGRRGHSAVMLCREDREHGPRQPRGQRSVGILDVLSHDGYAPRVGDGGSATGEKPKDMSTAAPPSPPRKRRKAPVSNDPTSLGRGS